MTVTPQRSALVDGVRSGLVALLAVLQAVVSTLVGRGLLGQPVEVVARQYPTPLLIPGWAALAWVPIHLGFLLYAGYQLLPRQRTREVHRRTGWWLAVAALAETGWLLAFGAHRLLLAELLIVVVLVCLAVCFGRLSHEPAVDVLERVAFRGPVALYTGWLSMIIVPFTAATGEWAGLPGDGVLSTVAAVVVLLAVTAVAAWVVLSGTAVLGYAVAAVWAVIGIALNDPPPAVVVAGAVAIVVLLSALARRLTTAGNPRRAGWG